MSSGRTAEDRVLTVPNAVTAVRLALIPVFVVLLAQPHKAHWEAAAWLLAGIGATDFVDGQLARRLNQVSTVGKALDPIADRLLLAVGCISIIAVGAVPVWVVAIALAREATVAALALGVAAIAGKRMDVTLAGKAGTFALMVALPLFLVGHAGVSWSRGAEDLAYLFAVPGLIFGWYAAVRYIPVARRALAERSRAG